MTLKEKFYISKQSTNRFRDEESNSCVKIAEEFAIGFANWCRIQDIENPNRIIFTDRLLKIYTKEKGL